MAAKGDKLGERRGIIGREKMKMKGWKEWEDSKSYALLKQKKTLK